MGVRAYETHGYYIHAHMPGAYKEEALEVTCEGEQSVIRSD